MKVGEVKKILSLESHIEIKEIRKRKVWYCPINDAEKIKSIREVLDHIARQFNGSFKN